MLFISDAEAVMVPPEIKPVIGSIQLAGLKLLSVPLPLGQVLPRGEAVFALGIGYVASDSDEPWLYTGYYLVKEFKKVCLAILWVELVDMKIRNLKVMTSRWEGVLE